MLLKLAWRNIWRNKRRSLIVFISIVIGSISILFLEGITNAFLNQMLFNQISLSTSHIQIHKNGFRDNKVIQNFVPSPDVVETILSTQNGVKAFSKRGITFGLLSSAENSSGIYLYGIEHENEGKISKVKSSIIEGKYLTGAKGEILLGKKLAEKLNATIGDKVIGMANELDGSIGSDVFRIVGIFETENSEFDKTNIFINLNQFQSMLKIPGQVHEFAVVLEDYKSANEINEEITNKLNNKAYESLTYAELLPLLILQIDLSKESMFVVYFIVGLALIFGIINSMLMSVFERINELGILLAIGMKTTKIFGMILFESFLLGLFATVIGSAVGGILIAVLSDTGINLSLFAESLNSYGIGAILYPTVSYSELIGVMLTIPIVSIVGAIYPAVKAIKLQPVEAIRYI
jgi:ABC-type lipoprotein release transport system permease subunit